jgi:ADP-ribosylglycohydrolase
VADVYERSFPLNPAAYADKVLGGWLGKAIGGTLGAPCEGKKSKLSLNFYDPVPEGSVPNDDLDLQLVWLHALQTKGLNLTVNDLAKEWLAHITYPFDEYGVAIANLKKGLRPPISGSYNNFFSECMGSPIRSEIWGFISPAQPLAAMEYAFQDAVVDHAGDGVYGEVFLAVIESMAFVESRAGVLLEYGLAAIPPESRVAKAVRDTVSWFKQGLSWEETREQILFHHGRDNFTDCPQNIAFIVLGWLCGGGDFEKSITAAVNCGYDTDCTAATLGAILGVILGEKGIPRRWKEPVGSEVVVGAGVADIDAPRTLAELSELTCGFGEQLFNASFRKPTLRNLGEKCQELKEKYKSTYAFYEDQACSFVVDYQSSPVLGPQRTIRLVDWQAEASAGGKLEIPVLSPVFWRLKLMAAGRLQAQRFWLTEGGDLRLSEIENAAEIMLETFVHFPEPAKAKLLVDINGQVETRVNGKTTHAYHNHEPLLPAPHRCAPEDIALVNFQAGWNKLTIKISRCCRQCAQEGWFLIADLTNHLAAEASFPASWQEFARIQGGKDDADETHDSGR